VRTTVREFSARPGANLEIQPGMTATIEIKTGSKTVLQYITKPLVKTMSESLGER
jgi:adhesin transport system membrane fusion protein